jgi:hypothetical protein
MTAVPPVDQSSRRSRPLAGLGRRLLRVAEWANGDARRDVEALHLCNACRADFVNPVDWTPSDDEHWWIRLRCGQCGEGREVVVVDAVAERFDRELDIRMRKIADELARIDRELMTAQVEAMIGALHHGLIDASDFAR